MDVSKALGLALILLSLAVSGKAKAGTATCHSCTDQQIEAMAWNNIGNIQAYGPMYIFDLDRGVVKKYVYQNNMTPEFDPENDPLEAWVESWPVEPGVQAKAAELQAAVVTAKADEHEILNVPSIPGLPEDAYDAIANPSENLALINHIRNEAPGGLVREFLDILAGVDWPFINEDAIRYPQPVAYSDGSTAMYVYNQDTQQWERAPDSSRDRNGNLIPESVEDIYGEGERVYIFGDLSDSQNWDAFNDFWDYLSNSGIPVQDASQYSLMQSGSYGMTCTEDLCTIWYIY